MTTVVRLLGLLFALAGMMPLGAQSRPAVQLTLSSAELAEGEALRVWVRAEGFSGQRVVLADGATLLASGELNLRGEAELVVRNLAPGRRRITARLPQRRELRSEVVAVQVQGRRRVQEPIEIGGALATAAFDADLDGRMDLLVATREELLLLMARLDGTYDPAVKLARWPESVSAITHLLPGDWDGDGRWDVLVGTDTGVELWLGGRERKFRETAYRQPVEADVNGDGIPDVLVEKIAADGKTEPWVWMGMGAGGFVPVKKQPVEPRAAERSGGEWRGGVIAGGDAHSLRLRGDGTVWAWGRNDVGQLGDGSTTQRLTPVQVSGLSGVVAIAAGGSHSLSLKSDGTVWAWGEGRPTPAQVSGLSGVAAIACGSGHSLALKSDGTVWAWGANGDGQLGDGSTTQRQTPVPVSALTGVVAIAGGGFHSLAVKSDGTVWAWGKGRSLTPVAVSGLTGVAAIAGGADHSLALKSDGTVWAWGSNGYGQLGDGSTTNRLTPVPVSGVTGVEAIAAGSNHSLALKSDGTVWAWGYNYSLTPAPASGLTGVDAIAGGGLHSLAVKSNGTVSAWGANTNGQLGDGTTTQRPTPVAVGGLAGVGVTAIACGWNHSLALKGDGTVWAWGNNYNGQLGDGTLTTRWAPDQVSGLTGMVAIAGGGFHSLALKSDRTVWEFSGWTGRTPAPVSGLAGVVAIAGGAEHSLALKSDGTVWAWGRNYEGQLGDGTTTLDRRTPSPVSGLTGVVAIAGGGYHSLAVKSDGTVRAWGYNFGGELGDGTATDRWTPVPVSGLAGVMAVAAGCSHSLALKSDGTVWAWGLNDSGELGSGFVGYVGSTPTPVSGLTGVVAVAAGCSHSLALKNDGTVWAWGNNDNGRLGDGSTTQRLTPVPVSGLTGVVAIAGGLYHSLARKADGMAFAWGANDNGQLGDGSTTTRLTPVPLTGLGPTNFAVSAIWPSKGGDTGSFTGTIIGSEFVIGAVVKLVRAGQTEIAASPVGVGPDGRTISATFDLRGKARGAWDVVVINPDGRSAGLLGGFTIEEGRAPKMWVDVIGRTLVRVGRSEPVQVMYGNSGNLNGPAQLLSLRASEGARLGFPNLPQVTGVPLRVFAAGGSGLAGSIPPGAANSVGLQMQAEAVRPFTVKSAIVDRLPVFFGWDRLASAGVPIGENPAHWAEVVRVARGRIGEYWHDVMTAVRYVADQSGQDARTLADFDRLLRYTVAIYGTGDSLGGAATQTSKGSGAVFAQIQPREEIDPSQVRVYATGTVLPNPERCFVVTHGMKGTEPNDRFQQTAALLKAQYPNANVFIVDWTPLSKNFFPKPVADNINPVGDVAAQTFATYARAGTFDPMKTTFIGESFGNYVNYRIADNLEGTYKLGRAYQAVVFNPASEYGGYPRLPDFQDRFTHSVALMTYSILDTTRKVAEYNLFLETPEGLDFRAQHIYGLGVFLQERLRAGDKSWVDGSRTFARSPEGFFDGMARLDGTYRANPFALWFDPLYPDLASASSTDKTFQVGVVGSFDPNDKSGSQGAGPARYLTGEQPLRYAVFFENLQTATAPAQEVAITDQLDTASLDLATFSLGQISFGSKLVSPPPGLRDFTTDVDLRPANNLIVRITAGLNTSTGLLTWRFRSLDQVTMQPPTDPLAGFLPPNRTSPEGQGSVLFTVMPKAGLPTGTQIRNRASIVFDTNAAILTPEWLNTLDNSKPASQVLALAPTLGPSFTVHWPGADQGAGILDYTIYVSQNSGPFTPWLTNTTETSAIFGGSCGSTYAFYSVARDLVGNLEDAPPAADTVTSVQLCMTLSVQPRPLTFVYRMGDAVPAPQGLALTSSGLALSYSATAAASGGVWVSVNPASGSTPANPSVSVNPAGLTPGIYHGAITVTAAGAWNSPVVVPVALAVIPATGSLAAPSAVSVSPAAGSALSQTYSFTFSSPYGWQSLGVVNVLTNFWLDGRQSCYLAYSRPNNTLYLINDAGNGYAGWLALDGSGTLGNSQCMISGAGSSVSGAGNTMTLTLNMSFGAPFAGTKIIYTAARDLVENNSGWQRMGVWKVPGAAQTTTTAVAGMNPARGNGTGGTFTYTFTDTNGANDLGVMNILVNDWLDGRHACYLAYARGNNTLYLMNDNGDALLPGKVLNGSGSLGNSQCTVNGVGSSATPSGNSLTLTLNMTFGGGFAGNRVFYLAARDVNELNNTGWQAMGSWTVQ